MRLHEEEGMQRADPVRPVGEREISSQNRLP